MKPRIRVSTDGVVLGAYNGSGALVPISRARRDAARHDIHELAGWNPGVSWGGSDPLGDRNTILGRARDLDSNNGWINAGLDRRVEAVIGESIQLSAQPAHQVLGRDIQWRMAWAANTQVRYRVWANDIDRRCDARKRLSIGQIARLAYLGYIRDGEATAEIRDDDRGLPNTTNVLLIEPERVSHPQDRGLTESARLRNGIAYDENGAAEGYWVKSRHANDPNPEADRFRWDYVPARGPTGRARFIHVFSPRRAEQLRGISRLAEAMVPAKMVDRVDRAEVAAALKSAIFSLFIKSPGTTDDLAAMLAPAGSDSDSLGWVDEYLDYRKTNRPVVDGAQVNVLYPGEDVVTPERSSPNTNYPEFVRFVLQKIAGSLGISYPQLSQDWEGINYSSARTLLNEMWRSFLQDRTFFCQSFLTPIYAAWLEVEVALGEIKVPGGPANFYRYKTAICMAEWIGPGKGSVDPNKEADANNKDTAAGRVSTIECIRERGRDPDDVLAEELAYNAKREAMGLGELNHNLKANDTAAASQGDGTGDPTQDEPTGGRRSQQEGTAQ